MFGVNLKLRYPFIGAIVGSGIGSAYIAFFKVKSRIRTAGLPGFISINPVHAGWLHYFCWYDNIIHRCHNSYFNFIEKKSK